MSNVVQEIEWYKNYANFIDICEGVQKRIDNGWRVHAFLERQCNVLVVYEKNA